MCRGGGGLVAELSAAARATVGKSHAATAVDVKVTTILIGLAVIMAAFVISWAAEGATPRRLYWQKALTEHEAPSQDFYEHLATVRELLQRPVFVPVTYPQRTAPGITATMHQGFRTATWQVSDPELRSGGPRGAPW